MGEGEHTGSADGGQPPDSDLIRRAQREAEELRRAGGSAHGRIVAPDVPGYELVREIHRGGQGVVYEAVQLSTRRRVAIKFLREGFLSDDRERARFEREVDVLSQLSHPNIVVIQDTGVAEGVHYHVMDYIDGLPLDVFLADNTLDIHATLDLFRKICDAVSAAHLRGVIHRDLKPANILIDDGGEPHILDFGLARLVTDTADEKTPVMTITGQFVGSLPWASPEQAEGLPDKIDVRTDVYSLGVILYQMLTGRFPYEVVGAMRDVLENILHKAPARPSTVRRGINNEIETIVLKCLSKERERRYQSAGEVARDIGHYLNGEPIEAKRDSGWYVLRKTLARHRAVAGVVLLVLVLLTGWGVTMAVLLAEAQHQANVADDQRREAERLAVLAERERIEAEAARAAEAERADQLEKVSAFQEAQLSGIDAALMGIRLRNELLQQKRASLLTAAELEESALDPTLRDLESGLSGINFTNLALRSLEENIIDRALRAIEERFADEPLLKARLLQTVASTMIALGMIERAMSPQTEALEIRRRELGEDAPETLSSIVQMSQLLSAQGRYEQAEELARNAIDGLRQRAEHEVPAVLDLQGQLASLLGYQGRYEESASLAAATLEATIHRYGEDDPRSIRLTASLGAMYYAMGRYGDAEPYLSRAVEAGRQVLGETDPQTMQSINQMVLLLHQQGRLSDAETLQRELLDRLRHQRGDEHPDTLTAIGTMGGLLYSQGRFNEAERYFREVMESARRVLGQAHAITANAHNNYGYVLVELGRYEDAESHFRLAMEGSAAALGREHPQTLFAISNLGAALLARGQHEEAVRYMSEALTIRRRVLGDEHHDTLVSAGNLAHVLLELGRHEEAEVLLREVYNGFVRLHGEDHPDSLLSATNLVGAWQTLGRLDEAEALGADAAARAREALPAGH
jgi:eukaryotic-like serine/threonine-protein kinase